MHIGIFADEKTEGLGFYAHTLIEPPSSFATPHPPCFAIHLLPLEKAKTKAFTQRKVK